VEAGEGREWGRRVELQFYCSTRRNPHLRWSPKISAAMDSRNIFTDDYVCWTDLMPLPQ